MPGGNSRTHLYRPGKLKKTIRIICGKPHLERTGTLINAIKFLKIKELNRYQLTLHFQKTGEYVQLSCRRNNSSRNILNTVLHYHRLTTTKLSVAYQGNISRNSLPVVIHCSFSFVISKNLVKQHYITQCTEYEQVWVIHFFPFVFNDVGSRTSFHGVNLKIHMFL